MTLTARTPVCGPQAEMRSKLSPVKVNLTLSEVLVPELTVVLRAALPEKRLPSLKL